MHIFIQCVDVVDEESAQKINEQLDEIQDLLDKVRKTVAKSKKTKTSYIWRHCEKNYVELSESRKKKEEVAANFRNCTFI